jgi:glutathione synthase/RimK-type ligase-like ATP-grasp enzyme
MKIRIEPYKRWSGGAKALGKKCGILRATEKQVTKHGDFDIIINWGRNDKRFNGSYINKPAAVNLATDKLRAFECFRAANVPIPDFTVDKAVAQTWLDDGMHVVARTLLRANSGRGITLVGPADSELTPTRNLPNAPLYTQYVKKAEEYRVHVVFGAVIDVQQKKRKLEVPDDQVNWQIRNSSNGWIFARSDVSAPDCVVSAALAAVSALGLEFGAVDIGYNKHSISCVVFEVNTAPGLEGQTLDSYYGAFVNKFPSLNGGMYRKRRIGT